jgi:hypothetical protein
MRHMFRTVSEPRPDFGHGYCENNSRFYLYAGLCRRLKRFRFEWNH